MDELLPFSRMLNRINDLAVQESLYTFEDMVPWEIVARRLRHELQMRIDSGKTQKEAAGEGGHQSTVSKLLSNHDYVPRADSFLKVIYGLGISPREFFARIEGLPRGLDSDKNTGTAGSQHEVTALHNVVPVTTDDLNAFVLDLIDHLQDLVARHDARRQQERALAQPGRKTAPNRQAKASENSRTRTQR